MRKLVLVIEDDMDTRDAVSMFLSYEGYDVRLAPFRDCALHMVDGVNAILMDYNMPGMRLNKFLELVSEKNSHPCVILMSCEPKVKELAERFGIQHFIAKPFLLEELGALVAGCIKDQPIFSRTSQSPAP
jgi:DNA-binding NtrC family response regulator